LTADSGLAMVKEAADQAASAGMPWGSAPIDLKPAPKLVDLIRRSRRSATPGESAQEPQCSHSKSSS